MNYNDCLLCNDAPCRKACGVFDPDRLLRSLYFENEDVVKNRLNGSIPCLHCDGRCRKACPMEINIRKILLQYAEDNERKPIDYSVLKTDFCGFPLENPFLISSSVVSSTYDM